jgi:exodeoxyribonuclease V alpha subunit
MLPATLDQQQSGNPDLLQVRSRLEALQATGDLSPIDLQTAYFFFRHAEDQHMLAAALGATLSHMRQDGHVCLDLQAGPPLWQQLLGDWQLRADSESLAATGLIAAPGGNHPVVMEGPRLWLQRTWKAESRLARALCERMDHKIADSEPELDGPGLDPLQIKAVAQAMVAPICVVSGGPGTGKTTVAAEIIAQLLLSRRLSPEHIALAAPTGKAAARLQTAVNRAISERGLDVEMSDARTLHRLLRFSPRRRAFLHHADNPLPADLVVVDEASMVDLEMMSALLQALPPECRLVLLGDRDQLASVSPGSVMADICQGVDQPDFQPQRRERIVLLQTSFRFAAGSGIAKLADAIRAGDVEPVLTTLSADHPDLEWLAPARIDDPVAWLGDRLPEDFISGLRNDNPAVALAGMDSYRVLCAHRGGGLGTHRLNRAMAEALRQSGVLIEKGGQDPAINQLLLVTANDYRLRVFNGDVGLVRVDESGAPVAWFVGDSEPRSVPARRLSHTESAFAMTVHKSQGSEYDQVVVVLPEPPSPLLTRELLYTAVTRARRGLTLVATEAAIRTCVGGTTVRYSGLGHRLWDSPAPL